MDTKWSLMGQLISADGLSKFQRLANVILSKLTIMHSNAECERVFSQVKKTRTQFQSSLSDANLEKLLIVKSLQKGFCYDQCFDKEFLKAAKSSTFKTLTSS